MLSFNSEFHSIYCHLEVVFNLYIVNSSSVAAHDIRRACIAGAAGAGAGAPAAPRRGRGAAERARGSREGARGLGAPRALARTSCFALRGLEAVVYCSNRLNVPVRHLIVVD